MVAFLFLNAGLVPVGGLVFILVLILTVAKGSDKTLLRPFLLVFLLGCFYFYLYSANADPFTAFDGKQVTITGEVISVQKPYEDYYKLELSAETYYFEGRIVSINEKMLVNLKGALDYVDAEDSGFRLSSNADLAGRHIQIRGIVDRPPPAKNPRLFDYKLYLKTRNINTILESKTWQCTLSSEKVHTITNGLSRYKFALLEKLSSNMSLETFGLMAGILFGDKNFIGDDIYQAFQKNGTSHILLL